VKSCIFSREFGWSLRITESNVQSTETIKISVQLYPNSSPLRPSS